MLSVISGFLFARRKIMNNNPKYRECWQCRYNDERYQQICSDCNKYKDTLPTCFNQSLLRYSHADIVQLEAESRNYPIQPDSKIEPIKIYNYSSCTSQEFPAVSHISFAVAGCPNNCKNCFWEEMKKNGSALILSYYTYRLILEDAKTFSKMVVFLGGEWNKEYLISLLQIARNEYGLMTCLYTGLVEDYTKLDKRLLEHLDYVKTGHYDENLGPLKSEKTNQRMIRVRDGKCLNFLFQKPEEEWSDWK